MRSGVDDRQVLERARVSRVAGRELEQLLDEAPADDDWKLTVDSSGVERQVVVPRAALERLVEVLEALGAGRDPSVVPMAKELSSGELAGLLGVSRQYAVRLLDEERLPSRRVGNRRRVLLRDALDYLRRDDRRRQAGLRELAQSL